MTHDLCPFPRNSLSVPKIEKNTNLGPPINSPSVPEVEHEIWQPYSAWRNVCLGKQKYNIMHQWLWLLHSNPPLTCPALHFPFIRIRKEKKEHNAVAGVTIRTGLMYILCKYNTKLRKDRSIQFTVISFSSSLTIVVKQSNLRNISRWRVHFREIWTFFI